MQYRWRENLEKAETIFLSRFFGGFEPLTFGGRVKTEWPTGHCCELRGVCTAPLQDVDFSNRGSSLLPDRQGANALLPSLSPPGIRLTSAMRSGPEEQVSQTSSRDSAFKDPLDPIAESPTWVQQGARPRSALDQSEPSHPLVQACTHDCSFLQTRCRPEGAPAKVQGSFAWVCARVRACVFMRAALGVRKRGPRERGVDGRLLVALLVSLRAMTTSILTTQTSFFFF